MIDKSWPTGPFTAIPNEIMDAGLPADTLGVLCYLLSRPADWQVRQREIGRRFGIGREKVMRIMRELKAAGFVSDGEQARCETGTWGAKEIRVHRQPWSENPTSVSTVVGLTVVGSTVNGSTVDGQSDTTKEGGDKGRMDTKEGGINPLSGSATPTKKGKKKSAYTPGDMDLAQWMLRKIREVSPNFGSRTNLDSWADQVRLIRTSDKRTTAEIRALFEWANSDTFWRTNILSPDTLRKQWDRLEVKRGANGKGHNSIVQADDWQQSEQWRGVL